MFPCRVSFIDFSVLFLHSAYVVRDINGSDADKWETFDLYVYKWMCLICCTTCKSSRICVILIEIFWDIILKGSIRQKVEERCCNKVRGDSFQQLETVKRVKGIQFNSNGHEVGNIWRIAERQTIQFSRISIHDTTRFPELIARPYDF